MSAHFASVTRRASIALGSQPRTSSAMSIRRGGHRIQEAKEQFALVIVKPMEKFGKKFVRGVR